MNSLSDSDNEPKVIRVFENLFNKAFIYQQNNKSIDLQNIMQKIRAKMWNYPQIYIRYDYRCRIIDLCPLEKNKFLVLMNAFNYAAYAASAGVKSDYADEEKDLARIKLRFFVERYPEFDILLENVNFELNVEFDLLAEEYKNANEIVIQFPNMLNQSQVDRLRNKLQVFAINYPDYARRSAAAILYYEGCR